MFTKKNSLLVVLIAGLLVFASSCKQPSSGSSETSVKSWENLKDVLDVIDSPNVSLRTNATMAPAMITPVDDQVDYRYVIMPMHFA